VRNLSPPSRVWRLEPLEGHRVATRGAHIGSDPLPTVRQGKDLQPCASTEETRGSPALESSRRLSPSASGFAQNKSAYKRRGEYFPILFFL
jgi:hypothetical protein